MSERDLALRVAGGETAWLRGYLDYVMSATDAPLMFGLGAGLVALAGALGSDISWRGGGGREAWPNLFVLVLAPSGIYRKSTSIDLATDLLERAAPGVIMDREFTPERFIRNLQASPTSVLKESEFSSLLERMKSSYMGGMKQRLTDLYDNQASYTRTIQGAEGKGEKISIVRPALSVLAASTLDWLVESLTETDMRSGFIPRFLFFAATEKETEPSGGYWADANSGLGDRMVRGLAALRRAGRARVTFGPARQRVVAWTAEQMAIAETESVPEELMGLYSRLGHHLAKFCALLQVSDDGPVEQGRDTYEVQLETAERAIALLEWIRHRTEQVFEERLVFSKFERQAQRALLLIGDGVDRGVLLKRLRVGAREMDTLLQTLRERGEIDWKGEQTRGRPRQLIFRTDPSAMPGPDTAEDRSPGQYGEVVVNGAG